MSTGTQTPVDRLTIGTRFVPTGMKRPVEALIIEDHPGYIVVGYAARGGFNVCKLSKYDSVATLPPIYTEDGE